MNRPTAYACGLIVGAATATAAWVRLAGHPPVKAASRAQLAAIQACIRALEALPTREWDDDEDGTPQRWGQDEPPAPRDPATGSGGGSEPVRPAESRTAAIFDVPPELLAGNWTTYANEEAARSFATAWLEAHRREAT